MVHPPGAYNGKGLAASHGGIAIIAAPQRPHRTGVRGRSTLDLRDGAARRLNSAKRFGLLVFFPARQLGAKTLGTLVRQLAVGPRVQPTKRSKIESFRKKLLAVVLV
jgi:hypothetical protein